MAQRDVPVGHPVQVGAVAYQIYQRTWQGRVYYSTEIGKPYQSPKTGQMVLLRKHDDKNLDDVIKAARTAKKQIADMKGIQMQQAYHHPVPQPAHPQPLHHQPPVSTIRRDWPPVVFSHR